MVRRALELFLVVVVLCAGLVACTDSGSDSEFSDNVSTDAILSSTSQSLTSDSAGRVAVRFTIAPDVRAFQVEGGAPSGNIRIVSLKGPNGIELTTQGERADSTKASPLVAAFNWPSLGDDIQAGTYTAIFETSTSGRNPIAAGVPVTVNVFRRRGVAQLRTIRVNIVFVGPASGSRNTNQSFEDAVDIWRQVFGRQELQLDVRYFNVDGPRRLPNPQLGDALYESIARTVRPQAVNIVVGTEVTGANTSSNEFGVAGGVPGAIAPTRRSAVAIDLLQITGSDGEFNSENNDSVQKFDNEIRVLQEEMARLTGLYLGLRNVIDFAGSTITATDSLTDTATCLNRADCEDSLEPRNNFMYPQVVPDTRADNSRRVFPRDDVSNQQAASLLRSPLFQ